MPSSGSKDTWFTWMSVEIHSQVILSYSTLFLGDTFQCLWSTFVSQKKKRKWFQRKFHWNKFICKVVCWAKITFIFVCFVVYLSPSMPCLTSHKETFCLKVHIPVQPVAPVLLNAASTLCLLYIFCIKETR